MKKCPQCKRELDESNFYKSKKDGLQSWCKQCAHTRRIQYYKDHRVYEDEQHKKNRQKYIERYLTYKSTLSCKICGYNKCTAALDFHHPEANKESNVGTLLAGQHAWKRVLVEIAKCIVLCSNCHRELHFLERQGVLV